MANWVIICYLPPTKGTRKLHWWWGYFRCESNGGSFPFFFVFNFEGGCGWLWYIPLQVNHQYKKMVETPFCMMVFLTHWKNTLTKNGETRKPSYKRILTEFVEFWRRLVGLFGFFPASSSRDLLDDSKGGHQQHLKRSLKTQNNCHERKKLDVISNIEYIPQLMASCWFGARWFGFLGSP